MVKRVGKTAQHAQQSHVDFEVLSPIVKENMASAASDSNSGPDQHKYPMAKCICTDNTPDHLSLGET